MHGARALRLPQVDGAPVTAPRKPDGFDLMLAAHSPDASVRAAAEKMLRRGRKKSAPRKPSAAPRPLSKAEARRRVASGTAALLNEGGENIWLSTDTEGDDLSEADTATMIAARDELIAYLRRRATPAGREAARR
mgnify:CR=1 FL=1